MKNIKMKKVKPLEIFYYRMHLLIEAHQKRLLGKLPTNLFKKLTLEERDSVLMGLLKQHKTLEK